MVIIRFPTVLVVHFPGHTVCYGVGRSSDFAYSLIMENTGSNYTVTCATLKGSMDDGIEKIKAQAVAELDRIEAELREYHING